MQAWNPSRAYDTDLSELKRMIIDFHTHIFPDSIRQNRSAYFSGEPDFETLYRSPTSRLAGIDGIISQMDAHGIDCSVVFGFPWKNITTVRMHNDYVLEAVSRHPGRLIGFCCVDPAHPESPEEARRCIRQGLSGLGELAFYSGNYSPAVLEQLDPLMSLCREKDLPVLLHTNEPVGHEYPGKCSMSLTQIYQLIQAFPLNKIVLAHWGGGIFLFHLMKKDVKLLFKHVYFDTAASPYVYDPDIYRIAGEIVGLHKILFGSDAPLLSPERYFSDMRRCGLSETDVQQISGLNAKALLKIG